MPRNRLKGVVFQPDAYRHFQRGVNQIADAVRPTLGPHARTVANFNNYDKTELLDQGGVIARRIVELPDGNEDMGAMYLRHMLWKLHEEHGDGTATAAVLFQAIYNGGIRYMAAGGNAMRLRTHLEAGMRVVLDTIDELKMPIEGETALANVAQTISHDVELSKMLGEVFDVIGEHGALDIRKGRTRGIQREYVEGSHWYGGIVSREMYAEQGEKSIEFQDTAIFISDLEFKEPADAAPPVRAALQAGKRSLILLGANFSDRVIGFLLTNTDKEKFRILAVETPGLQVEDRAVAMQDLALLTGGAPFIKEMGQAITNVRPEHLGIARVAWANRFNFGVRGGKGDPRALRRHIKALQQGYKNSDDPDVREKLQKRIGKLMGGSATLRVGAHTEEDMQARKRLAETTANALRGAVADGIVPGGGVTFLHCAQALREALDSIPPDEDEKRAAYRILMRAMEEPLRALAQNSGFDPGTVMANIFAQNEETGVIWGYDLRNEQVVDVIEAGIVDVSTVIDAVVQGAIRSSALALTVDALVHVRTPHRKFDT